MGELEIKYSEWLPLNSSKRPIEDIAKLPFTHYRQITFLHVRTTMLMFGPKNAPSMQTQYLYLPEYNYNSSSSSSSNDLINVDDHTSGVILTITFFEGIPMCDVFKVLLYSSFEMNSNSSSSSSSSNIGTNDDNDHRDYITVVNIGLYVHFVKSSFFKHQIQSGTKEEVNDQALKWLVFAKMKIDNYKNVMNNDNKHDNYNDNKDEDDNFDNNDRNHEGGIDNDANNNDDVRDDNSNTNDNNNNNNNNKVTPSRRNSKRLSINKNIDTTITTATSTNKDEENINTSSGVNVNGSSGCFNQYKNDNNHSTISKSISTNNNLFSMILIIICCLTCYFNYQQSIIVKNLSKQMSELQYKLDNNYKSMNQRNENVEKILNKIEIMISSSKE